MQRTLFLRNKYVTSTHIFLWLHKFRGAEFVCVCISNFLILIFTNVYEDISKNLTIENNYK